MKLGELLQEMAPYHAKGDKPPKHWEKTLEMFYSKAMIEREFSILGKITLQRAIRGTSTIDFIVRNEGRTIYGVYEDTNRYNELGFRVMFTLEFKAKSTLSAFPKDIRKRSILQVSKVNTDKDLKVLV